MIDSISNFSVGLASGLATNGNAAASSASSPASAASDSAPGTGDFAKLLAQSAKPSDRETTPDESDVKTPASAAIDITALTPAIPHAPFDAALLAQAALGDDAANADALQALDAQFAALLPFAQLAPIQVPLPRGELQRAAPPLASAILGADPGLLTSLTQAGAEPAQPQIPTPATQRSGAPDAAAVAGAFAALMAATPNTHPNAEVAAAGARWATSIAALGGIEEQSATSSAISDLTLTTQLSPALSFLQTAAGGAASAHHGGTVLVATHIDAPSWNKDFGQHVIRLATDGQPAAEIHLNPPELGPIRISIEFKGQDATINFAASHAHTRGALESALPALRELFAANDLSLAGANVSSDAFSQNPSSPHDERHPGHAPRHSHTLHASDEVPINMAAVRIPLDGARVDLFA